MFNFPPNPNKTIIIVFGRLKLKQSVWKCHFVVPFYEWFMKFRNINAYVCIVWSLTYLNIQCTFTLKRIQKHFLKRIYRRMKVLNKCGSCHGNCVTGNFGEGIVECEEWRCWYWECSVRRSMIQTRRCPSVTYCRIFHSQNKFVCICVRHNLVLFAVLFSLVFWMSYLLNQNNTTPLCKIGNCLLFWKTFKRLQHNVQCKPPASFTLMPSIAPNHPNCPSTNITFVCVHLDDWNWDCKVLFVMKCGGCTH